jgi:hypothetical protein
VSHQGHTPAGSPRRSNPRDNSTRTLLIIAVILAVLVMIAIGTFVGIRAALNDATDQLISSNASASDPVLDTRIKELDYAGPILNSNVEATTRELNDALDQMGYSGFNYFNRPIVAPSSTNTPQEIWDQITLGSFQSWNIAQGGDIEEAKRVVAYFTQRSDNSQVVADYSQLFAYRTVLTLMSSRNIE